MTNEEFENQLRQVPLAMPDPEVKQRLMHRAVRRERGSSLPPATGDELRDIIPSLSIEPTRMTESVTDSLLDILLLMVLNVVFFMLAFMFFLRYDVR